MKRGQIFNEEKVLYFASTEASFHVQPNEPKDSDCRLIVNKLARNQLLASFALDKSGEFYSITKAGEIRLLKLQIQWRLNMGKNVDKHKAKLAEFESKKEPTQ
jgi:hypothetical protein